MNSQDGKTISSWWPGVQMPACESLRANRKADVCVVGAGIAGLSVAYHLTQAGKKVIVLDDSAIGDGQTGRTSAHLASAWDDRFQEAEKSLGAEGAKVVYESHAAAINSIESIAQREKIDCDFRRVGGWLILDPDHTEKFLDDELAAAHRAGFLTVTKHARCPAMSSDSGPCLRFPDQAEFHPLKYLAGLARAIVRDGGEIFCGSHVKDVQGKDEKTGEPARATTDENFAVTADSIVVCTNAPGPINDWMGIYLKQAPYRTYVIGVEVPAGSVERALVWDTHDPYHYVRVQSGDAKSDLLLIGGEDHKTGQAKLHDDPFAALYEWAKPKFKNLGAIKHRWSGQVQEPDDGCAFIGLSPHAKANVYVATGDSGMGLTHGAIAGMLISEQILGREHPQQDRWRKVYDPSRKPSGALKAFAAENANAVKQYCDYFSGGEVSDEAEISPGSGAVMRQGLSKLAVYRDEKGDVHKCSAVCTHLGCLVAWNGIEKTWDCPCHGARYDPLGQVIMGPAISNLARIDP